MIIQGPFYLASCSLTPPGGFGAASDLRRFNTFSFCALSVSIRRRANNSIQFPPALKMQPPTPLRLPPLARYKNPEFLRIDPPCNSFLLARQKLLEHRFRTGQSSLRVAVSHKSSFVRVRPETYNVQNYCVFRRRAARVLLPPRCLVRLFSLVSSRPDEIIPDFWRSMPSSPVQTRPRKFSPPRFSARKRTIHCRRVVRNVSHETSITNAVASSNLEP